MTDGEETIRGEINLNGRGGVLDRLKLNLKIRCEQAAIRMIRNLSYIDRIKSESSAQFCL